MFTHSIPNMPHHMEKQIKKSLSLCLSMESKHQCLCDYNEISMCLYPLFSNYNGFVLPGATTTISGYHDYPNAHNCACG